MPRTMFVLPTSTTRRDDIALSLREDQLSRADREGHRAVVDQGAALVVDPHPGSADPAVVDDRGDAVAGRVDGHAAPFAEDAVTGERAGKGRVDVAGEGGRRRL